MDDTVDNSVAQGLGAQLKFRLPGTGCSSAVESLPYLGLDPADLPHPLRIFSRCLPVFA